MPFNETFETPARIQAAIAAIKRHPQGPGSAGAGSLLRLGRDAAGAAELSRLFSCFVADAADPDSAGRFRRSLRARPAAGRVRRREPRRDRPRPGSDVEIDFFPFELSDVVHQPRPSERSMSRRGASRRRQFPRAAPPPSPSGARARRSCCGIRPPRGRPMRSACCRPWCRLEHGPDRQPHGSAQGPPRCARRGDRRHGLHRRDPAAGRQLDRHPITWCARFAQRFLTFLPDNTEFFFENLLLDKDLVRAALEANSARSSTPASAARARAGSICPGRPQRRLLSLDQAGARLFRRRDSISHDLSTLITPEFHTASNVDHHIRAMIPTS